MAIHFSTTILLLLLTVSAVGSRGFVPNMVVALLILVWRGPISPSPVLTVYLGLLVNFAHILAFMVVSILVSTSDTQRDSLYGSSQNKVLLEGFSLFEPIHSQTGLCFRSMTPSVVIFVYALLLKKRISGGYVATNKPGGRKGAVATFREPSKGDSRLSRQSKIEGVQNSVGGLKKGSRHVLHKSTTMRAISTAARTTVLMALCAAVTSLVAPNLVALPFLVIFTAVLCIVAIFPWSNKARGTLLRVVSAIAALYTPLWLLFLTLSQNALYIEYVGSHYYVRSIEGYGILPIDSLPSTDIIVRRYVSILFGFCATVLASVASAQSPAAYEAYTELKMILDIEAKREALARGVSPNPPTNKHSFVHRLLVKLGRKKDQFQENDSFDDVVTQLDGAFFVPPSPGTRPLAQSDSERRMSLKSPGLRPGAAYSGPSQSFGGQSVASSACPRSIRVVIPHNKYDPPVLPLTQDEEEAEDSRHSSSAVLDSQHSINSMVSQSGYNNDRSRNGSVPPSVALPSPTLTPRLHGGTAAEKQALLADLQRQLPLHLRIYSGVKAFIASFVDGLFHYLLFIPVLPLLAVSMSIVIFPSITSLVMLPVVWLGLLIRTSNFTLVMPVAVVVKGVINVAQFALLNAQTTPVLDGKEARSTPLILLYYSERRIYFLVELFTNVAIFALLAAVAYRQIMSLDGRHSGGFGNIVKVGSRKSLPGSKILNSISRRSQRSVLDSRSGSGLDDRMLSDEEYLIAFREDIIHAIGRRRAANIVSRIVPRRVVGYDPFVVEGKSQESPIPGSGLTLDKRDNEPIDIEATFEKMLGRKAGAAELQSLRRYFRLTQVNAFPMFQENNSEISFVSQNQQPTSTSRRSATSAVGDTSFNPAQPASARESQHEIQQREAMRASNRADALGQALESEGGNGGVTKWGLLEFFASYSEVSTLKQSVLLVRFLVIQYSMPLALLFTFVVGSLVKVLDMFHVVQLLIFLVFICFPSIAHRYWVVVVAYTILLTSFLSFYTFLQPFLSEMGEYAIDGIKWETIGFYPYRTIWYAVPYYLCCFLVAAELMLVRGLISHPHDWVVAYDWRRMASKDLSLKWQRRITITVATFVFLGLAVYKSASFLVEGLLLLLLVIAFCTAYSVPEGIRKVLWIFAVVYSMVAIVLVCCYQFKDLRGAYRWVFNSFESCTVPYRPPGADPSTPPIDHICEAELGVVAGDQQILTEFLAPWFVVLVVSFVHLSATIQSQRMETKRRLGGDSSAAFLEVDDSGDKDTHGENLLAAEEQLVGRGVAKTGEDDMFASSHDNRIVPGDSKISTINHSSKSLMDQREYSGGGESANTHNEAGANAPRSKASMLFGSKDQRAIYLVFTVIEKLEDLFQLSLPIAQDIAPYLVWGALYLATTADYNLATLVYGIFLVLDVRGKFTLLYCVAHIFVLYTYSFVFFPKIESDPSLNLAAVIGVLPHSPPRKAIVEPLLVFFAVLLSEMTRMKPEEKKKVFGTRVEKTTSWVEFFRFCYFDFAGFEVTMLTLLRTYTDSSRYISGVTTLVSVLLLLAGGRNSFLTSRMRRFGPYFLTTLCFLYTFVTLLNVQQVLWLPSSDHLLRRDGWWLYFMGYGDDSVLLGNFFTLCMLHMANQRSILSINREIRTKTEFGNGVASSLPQYLALRGVWELSDIPDEEFGSVVPLFPDTDYCYDLVGRLLNGVVLVLYPLAIASFAAGLSHGSLLHLLLLAAGLIQLLNRNTVFWRFNIVWPRIFVAYVVPLLFIPVIMPIAPISNFIGNHPTAFNILGLAIHGQPLYFHPVFVSIVFFLLIHDRVMGEFSFANTLHYLSKAEGEQQVRHVELIGTLKKLDAEEVSLAMSKQEELKQELHRIRLVSKSVVRDTELNGPAPPQLVFSPTHTKTETAEEVIRHQHEIAHAKDDEHQEVPPSKQPSKVSKPKKAKKVATINAPGDDNAGNDNSPTAVYMMGSSARIEAGLSDPVDDEELEEEDPNSLTSKMKVRLAAMKEKLTSLLLFLVIKFRHYSFERDEPEKWQNKSPLLRCSVAFLLLLERHVNDIILCAVVLNFLISGTVWNAIPCAFLFIFAAPCYPFAPALIYDVVAVYVLVGMVIKNLMPIFTYNTQLSLQQANAISVIFIQIPTNDFGRSVKTGDISQTDRVCDFIVFALILAHQAVCNRNGVQPMTLRRKKDEFAHDDDPQLEHEREAAVDNNDENQPLVPALKGSAIKRALQKSSRREYDDADDIYARDEEDRALAAELVRAEEGGMLEVADEDDEDLEKQLDEAATAIYYARNGTVESPVDEDEAKREQAHPGKFKYRARRAVRGVRDFLFAYARNIRTRNGLGKDIYTAILLVECLGLIVFIFTYYFIQGKDSGSILSNVQSNLLPGPFVLVIFLSIVMLIGDRVFYIARQPIGKFVLVALTILVVHIGYVVWINTVHPDHMFVGSLFFAVKLIAAYLGCLQIRKGYSVDRRHDCFTHDPANGLLNIGYTIYRAIPFLWEIRVCIDWSCERSSLAFDHFLKVEDMYDIIYNRYVALCLMADEQPVFGTPFGLKRKISDGASRLVIMIVVLVFPLFYYSTFNPAMEDNSIISAKAVMTFDADNTLFSSSLLTVDPYPGPLATYLDRTRPTLSADDITSSYKTTQMLNLASCSSDIWSVSPQGMRLMAASLNASYYNVSDLSITLALTVERTGAQQNSGKIQTIQTTYPLTSAISKMFMDAMTSESDTVTVELPRFYTPFVFNQPAVVSFVEGTEHLGVGGSPALNPQDCTMRYRREYDTNLDTNVSYWCLKCNSLFTYSNYPNSSYPEWECITQGLNCKNYDMETYDTVYTPTSMYFVTISDKIPVLVSFLPNVGIVALYTTFVLTVGGVLRSMISGSVVNVIYMDMFDPTAVDKLVRYIYTARSGHDHVLEQSLYFELLDLLRSPEALLEVTKKYPRGYKDGDSTSQSPTSATVSAPVAF